jgi:acyl-CoA thioesterase YciA
MTNTMPEKPEGELATRTLALPRDVNVNGDIFGGWVMSQMDIAAYSIAHKYTQSRLVTVAVNSMSFFLPIHVGDFVSSYGQVIEKGRTSMKVQISVWVSPSEGGDLRHVTSGIFVYVSVDEKGKPIPLPDFKF